MKIKDFGGEFKLIEHVTKTAKDERVVVGVGDDTAVLDYGTGKLLLWTVDMLCEGDHFNTGWSSPYQIGWKAMEANISDIAAMGGTPTSVLVSLSLTKDTEVEWVEQLYEGMHASASKHGFEIIGGDTTHSTLHVINVTVLGEVDKENLCLRSDAKPGDLICVTGDLGKSMAGLQLLLKGEDGDTTDHLEPSCRLAEAQKIAPYANAMIDVSDGLASEVNHICRQSNVGAKVYEDKIPVSQSTIETAEKIGDTPTNYALNGGEDFELVFTISQNQLEKIEIECPITIVGEITKNKNIILATEEGEQKLTGGYNHFL